jgi:hypothetical protein
VRKAVLTLPMAAEIAALAALAGIASVPILLMVNGVGVCVVVQFWNVVVIGGGACANAPDEAMTEPARPARTKQPERRTDVKITAIPSPQTKNLKTKKCLRKN